MDDIVPGLLKQIQEDFQKSFDKSEVIGRLYAKIRDGTATYKEANEFAIEAGIILADAYKKNISSDTLPDGKMYYNIAERILNPTLKNNYDLITDVTSQVQDNMNKDAGIGIKAIKPEMNQDRVDGIVNKVSSADNYDEVSWVLDEPVKNLSQSIVDDSIKANADFQYNSGLSPRIIRTSTGKCCEWCSDLVGVYDYESVRDTGNAVFRRHQRCNCMVLFDPKDGKKKIQNVHSKKWRTTGESAKIEARKKVGLESFKQRTGNMDPSEYARAVDLWRQVDEYPDLPQSEKEYVYEEFDNNLTAEEKSSAIVSRPIGDHWYYAVNKGHNQYKIYEKRPIEPAKDIVDEVLTEMFGANWEEMLDE